MGHTGEGIVAMQAAGESLESLALRFREPLVRYFLRRGTAPEEAEDCAQDTLVRLAAADFSRLQSPEGYLFSIAASIWVDRGRRSSARREDRWVPLDDLSVASPEPAPSRVFEGRENLLRLAAVLDELPPRTREIFLLNRMDGLTYTQLAARYGIRVGSIEKHMTKALAHLKQAFRDD